MLWLMNTSPRDIDARLGRTARRMLISGRVQGVGFRPFVYRTAQRFGLTGWVRNGAGKVLLHVEGRPADIAHFEAALILEAPSFARPRLEASHDVAVEDSCGFRILASACAEDADVHVPPDLFCCDDCAAEFRDLSQRRFHYPFTNCTQCGPRYTIIAALPYDRPSTSMAGFALCPHCRAEYDNPLDRRFHAQPLACPDCGPQVTFHGANVSSRGDSALSATIALLCEGGIVAVKGVGGYHLMCDAESDAAVMRLRARKHRPHKPLAVIFPQQGDDGLDAVRACVTLNEIEARTCADPARPIVLARRRRTGRLSDTIAPGLNELGVFLPYSPLHHLLLARFARPLVATSGNVSGEPVITDEGEAERRLATVADAFLHHDRPILRPADDSVVRVIAGTSRPVRLGRGMAPLEIDLPQAFVEPILAVGGHMKGAIALGWGRRAVVSPHIGDLDSPRSLQVFEQVIGDLAALYRVEPLRIVCDAHPGYASTRWALAHGLPLLRVQHHAAHASALAGEHPDVSRWLVFTWDGVGLGGDGDLWGGEALIGSPGDWRHVASMRPFHLAGGDSAGREPWRSAAALMWETGRDWSPAIEGAAFAAEIWRKRIGTSRTSSVGRLFDAAASLILGLNVASFEGQGPMVLESLACEASGPPISLPLARGSDGIWRTDWEPLLPMLEDGSLAPGVRSGIFHESLAGALVSQVKAIAQVETFEAVGLTGGVFQNRRLAERVIERLSVEGIDGYLPAMLPANDGGLAFGQLIEALGRACHTSQQKSDR
jgi:hydrogenase maturation protein HypF